MVVESLSRQKNVFSSFIILNCFFEPFEDCKKMLKMAQTHLKTIMETHEKDLPRPPFIWKFPVRYLKIIKNP